MSPPRQAAGALRGEVEVDAGRGRGACTPHPGPGPYREEAGKDLLAELKKVHAVQKQEELAKAEKSTEGPSGSRMAVISAGSSAPRW